MKKIKKIEMFFSKKKIFKSFKRFKPFYSTTIQFDKEKIKQVFLNSSIKKSVEFIEKSQYKTNDLTINSP